MSVWSALIHSSGTFFSRLATSLLGCSSGGALVGRVGDALERHPSRRCGPQTRPWRRRRPPGRPSVISVRLVRWPAHRCSVESSMQRVLVSQPAGHSVGQEAGGAGQRLVAESVHRVDVVGQLTDIAAVLQLDALRHRNDDAGLFGLHPLHLLDEVVDIEGDLRQADHVHALAVLGAGQGGRGGQPAGVAAHDLNDGHILGAVNGGVADDLFHHHADVLGGAAVAGGCGR